MDKADRPDEPKMVIDMTDEDLAVFGDNRAKINTVEGTNINASLASDILLESRDSVLLDR